MRGDDAYAILKKKMQDMQGEKIQESVNRYFDEHPVQAGATAEQVQQIEQNKKDVNSLNEGLVQTESRLSESITDISDALFERTEASPNVYDISKKTDGSYIGSDGKVKTGNENAVLSDYIAVPNGKKAVFTITDSRDGKRKLVATNASILYSDVDEFILSTRITSASEIVNSTGSDCLARIGFTVSGSEAYLARKDFMVEIMDANESSDDAIGLTQYYEYYEESFGDKVKKTAIETEDTYSETGTYPVNGKAIADAIKSPLYGKKILFLGDSFTNSNSNTDYRYRHYIAQRTGCAHVNYGVSGSLITYRPTVEIESFPARAERMTEDCDMIVIFGGINDCRAFQKDITAYNKYYVIGTDEDIFDWDAEVNSLKACLKHVLDVLIAQYPTKSIVALLPPILNPKSDQYSEKVNEICQAEIDIYERYGIPYFDLRTESKISGCDAHVSLYNISEDNVHWNANGHLRASWGIQKFLEREII